MEDEISHKKESNRKTAASFWVIMQRVVVISPWRIGKTVAPVLRVQEILKPEMLLEITTTRCEINQKSVPQC